MIVTTDATMKTPTTESHSDFLKSLVEFTHDHRAARWSGTLSDFLESVFRNDPKGMVRTSHQYTWDMLRANGFDEGFSSGFSDSNKGRLRCQLFEDELFGIDDTSAACSTTSRRRARAPKSAGGCCCCWDRPPAASRAW